MAESRRNPTDSREGSAYLATDTIGALSTAVGGAISIVRVSGPCALAALASLTGSPSSAEPRRLTRALLRSGERPLDDALYVLFRAPDSFTGEDLVEFHLHGGGYTARLVLEALAAAGVRQALPGEFSFRAVRNGKLSLTQAQAAADLISASNDSAVSLALEKLSGAQNKITEELAASLRHLAALGEAGIDFSDQDLEEVSLPRLRTRLGPVLAALRALESSHERGVRIQEGISVALVGLPNAGKSSFFNALLGEDRSIVSPTAGTTRDVVRERLTLRGATGTVTLRLSDTAGLRKAHDDVERAGVERSHLAARDADLVLFVVDPQQSLDEARVAWRELAREGLELAARSIGILSKADAVSPDAADLALAGLQDLGLARWCITSSATGRGIADSALAIAAHAERWIGRSRGELLLTRFDQVQAVRAAISHLLRAQEAPEIALFAADLRQSLHALGPLIGETPADAILGKIFSEFCIGK